MPTQPQLAMHAANALAIQILANDILENPKLAMQWLLTPSMLLDGNRPIDALATRHGYERVQQLLTRLGHGVGL